MSIEDLEAEWQAVKASGEPLDPIKIAKLEDELYE